MPGGFKTLCSEFNCREISRVAIFTDSRSTVLLSKMAVCSAHRMGDDSSSAVAVAKIEVVLAPFKALAAIARCIQCVAELRDIARDGEAAFLLILHVVIEKLSRHQIVCCFLHRTRLIACL